MDDATASNSGSNDAAGRDPQARYHPDAIVKNLIRESIGYWFQLFLGEDLPVADSEWVETQYQKIEERRADLVLKVWLKQAWRIKHFEVQASKDKNMIGRMLGYYGYLRDWFPGLPIEQFVIILTPDADFTPELTDEQIAYWVHLIRMYLIDAESLLAHPSPAIFAFALLGKLSNDVHFQKIAEAALAKLRALHLSKELEATFIRVMETFAHKIGKQEEFLKIEQEMAFEYDLETDIRYRQGIEKGEQKGRMEGRMEAILALYDQHGFDAATIARTFGLELAFVKQVLQDHGRPVK